MLAAAVWMAARAGVAAAWPSTAPSFPSAPPDLSASTNAPAAVAPPAPAAVTSANSSSAPAAASAASTADDGTTPPPPLQVKPLIDTQLEQAGVLYDQKKYADALQAYTEILPQIADARREEVLYRIAESYRLLGRDDEAEAVYKLFADNFPSSLFLPTADYRRGEILYKQGKFAPALDLFTAAQKGADAATLEAARFYAAATQLKLNQEVVALPALQAFVDAKPPSPYGAAAAQMLAENAEKKSDWSGAVRQWQAVLDQSQEKAIRAQAASRAALALLQLGKTDDAEKLFQASRQTDPSGPYVKLANTGLLDLWFQQKRYQELVDFYNANREQFLDGSRAQIFLETARAYYRLKDSADAVHQFDLFLAQFKDDPQAPTAAYERLAARAELSRDNILGDTALFLATWPQSPYKPAVLFLRAQQYSSQKQFAEAKEIWDELAHDPVPEGLPAGDIYFEDARAHYELKEWKPAADAFALFIQKFPNHPGLFSARQCQAAALQNIPDPAGAAAAWGEVLKLAPAHSPDAQTAIEQIVALDQQLQKKPEMLASLRQILTDFPQSRLWPLAAYTLGAEAFNAKKYDEAAPLLKQAREADPKAWQIPATYRLLWIAYQKKDVAQTTDLARQYDAFPDPEAKAVRIPAAIYYWLGIQAETAKQDDVAGGWFTQVTTHPDPGNYLTSSWWELGEVNRRLKRWQPAVDAYETFRGRDPKNADNSPVLLALAEAQIGAGLYDPAKDHLDHVLIAEPEGKNNAQARFLTGEWYLAQKQYADALKSFTTLSLIYRDDDLTPRALDAAAQAAQLSGDQPQADALRKKLREQFPAFANPGT